MRRRLFEPLTDPAQFKDRDVVARAFADLYRTQHQEFPPECRDADYETPPSPIPPPLDPPLSFREAVRTYLAWTSILSEKELLDLSPHQVRQAETQKTRPTAQ